MTETPTSGLSDDLRSLRRSRSDRVIAGVAGGLGARLGIDPLVLRIVTVVLAIFGGVGIVLYAIGWLLIPDEGAEGSVAEEALGRRDGRPMNTSAVALAIGLILAIMIASGSTFGSGVGPLLLVLALIGVVAMFRRREHDDETDAEPSTWRADGSPVWSDSPIQDGSIAHDSGRDASHMGTESVDTDEPRSTDAHTAGPEPDVVPPSDGPTGTGWPEGPDWGPQEPTYLGDPYPADPYLGDPLPPEPAYAPRPPAAPPQRSYLGFLTLSAVVVALGVLAINDATWAAIPPSGYIATALAIVGIGLLVGTWFGRSRGLIGLGVLLALALPPAVIVGDDPNFNTDRTVVTITDIAEIPNDPVSYGAGQVTYDLSGLELVDTEEVALEISQRVGQLRVIVPPEADVDVTAVSSLGEVRIFDGMSGGIHAERSTVDLGPDGPGGGTITLDLSLSIGQIEVTR